jgi:hypothetical protein
MKRLSRAKALKIAAILSFVTGLEGLAMAVPLLALGANELNHGGTSPPFIVILLAFAFATTKIVSTYGVWLGHRWAIVLTLLAVTLDAVAAAPGILFAPTQTLWILSLMGVITGVVIIILCLWRGPKVIATPAR